MFKRANLQFVHEFVKTWQAAILICVADTSIERRIRDVRCLKGATVAKFLNIVTRSVVKPTLTNLPTSNSSTGEKMKRDL